MPEGGGATVAVEKEGRIVSIFGDDAGREARRLLVRDPQRVVEVVDHVERHGRDPLRLVRPLVAEAVSVVREDAVAAGLDRTGSPPHLEPLLLEDREQIWEELGRFAIDEREVQPVAHTEPVERRLGHHERSLAVGPGMDVEHAPTLGVGERAHSVLGGQAREGGGRLAAPAQDHERDPLRHRHEHSSALAIGGADEPDRSGWQAGVLESWSQHVVDEDGHGAESGATSAQNSCVQALQQLASDVEGDVRPSLEVRADSPDRDPPLADLEAVRQRPGVDLALERRDRRYRLDLLRERLHSLVVEAQPVEHALVQAFGRLVVVSFVRGEDLGPALAYKDDCGLQSGYDRFVGELRSGAARLTRLSLDVLAESHCRHSQMFAGATALPKPCSLLPSPNPALARALTAGP